MCRLTTRTKDGIADVIFITSQTKILEKLAHYEDLEEAGRLIELPCKVGDTMYSIIEDCNYIGSCRGMECEDCIYSLLQINSFKVSSIQHAIRIMGQFGKTVFLTKEEAEAKLAELKGGEKNV